jgi:hypothetical protein
MGYGARISIDSISGLPFFFCPDRELRHPAPQMHGSERPTYCPSVGRRENNFQAASRGFDLDMVKPAERFKLVEVVDKWFQIWDAPCH